MSNGWITAAICIGAVVIAIVFICILKFLMQGRKYQKKTKAVGKVVIVTGANSGIGKEAARELAKRGATVYLACRDMKRAEEARSEIVGASNNNQVFCLECDLSSLESIKKFVENFKKEQTTLNILINNAGVMGCPYLLTKDGFEMQLGVNHMGHFYLTYLLLDLLKKSAPSRIVVVSSALHAWISGINFNDLNSEKSYNATKAYNQSKLANVLFTLELSKRLTGSNVTVNALHPGVVDTGILRQAGPCIKYILSFTINILCWPFIKTAKSGAQTTIYAALDPDLDLVTGKYFSNCKLEEAAKQGKDDAAAKLLWSISEEWTKIKISV